MDKDRFYSFCNPLFTKIDAEMKIVIPNGLWEKLVRFDGIRKHTINVLVCTI